MTFVLDHYFLIAVLLVIKFHYWLEEKVLVAIGKWVAAGHRFIAFCDYSSQGS